MIRYIQKKMLRNKWLVLCLLLGFLVSIAVISSIPVYTNSILQRMLVRDLEAAQTETGQFPGNYSFYMGMPISKMDQEESWEVYKDIDEAFKSGLVEDMGLPILSSYKRYTYPSSYVNLPGSNAYRKKNIRLYAMQNMNEHIELIAGRLPQETGEEDLFEILLTEEALNNLGLTLDTVLDYFPEREELYTPIKLKIVGVFRYLDPADVYWNQNLSSFKSVFFMDFDTYEAQFATDEKKIASTLYWHYALDYHALQMENIPQLLSAFRRGSRLLSASEHAPNFEITTTLQNYLARSKSLNNMLSVMQAPTVIMLLFFIFMLSSLIMEHEKNDIAILKSRGASNLQVFGNSALQSSFIAAVAFILGPLLGYELCRVLGLCSGFLEFVSRKGLQVRLIPEAYLYSLIAVGVFLLTMLLPAISASRLSIVEYKRSKSAFGRTPLWKKLFLDVLLLAGAVYARHNYHKLSQSFLESNGSTGSYIDPTLFLINTLFVLGMGLLFLRLYPYLVRLIFQIGKRFWSPTLYAALLSVSRSKGKDQFISLFMILTVSIAIFNAASARTVNTFVEDRVNYNLGADFILEPKWETTESYYTVEIPEGTESDNYILTPISPADAEKNGGNFVVRTDYHEPPIGLFEDIRGLSDVTPVLEKENISVSTSSDTLRSVRLMGIVPYEFSRVAWFRSDLASYHLNDYLNLLAENPQAVLLSSSAQKEGIQIGDEIALSWERQPFTPTCIVYGFVDYWPGYNPLLEEEGNHLVVANFNYLWSQIKAEPYLLWANRDESVKSADIYQDITDKELNVASLLDRSQELVAVKNDAMLQGLNGALTLSFLVSVFVCLTGFLIYWILNIKSRTLQFGILRAMGLSKGSLLRMLLWEQLFISGGAILAAVGIGAVSSSLTVPLLQYLYPAAEQIPPFRITVFAEDYAKIFLVIAFMLLISILVLSVLINKLKIDQALKLGED